MKNSKNLNNRIKDSRRLLENPYAYLNGNDDYDGFLISEQISRSRRILKNQYAHLNPAGSFDAVISNSSQNSDFESNQNQSVDKYSWIENKVRDIHLRIWKSRDQLWPEGVPENPIELLDPSKASNLIGFDFSLAETLGETNNQNKKSEVAGIIDRVAKSISISRRLPHNTMRFTAAHELGHACLHSGTLLHRDRPIDGSDHSAGKRDRIEIEADKFASYFLMPEKLVRERFNQIFFTDSKFSLTDETMYALDPSNSLDLVNKTTRELARILASTEQYNGRDVYSLSTQFGVSPEAMAIRLEELKLV